ncbi:hypothetical protein ACWES4_30805, partial [Streptomyces sp. NPDC004011]
MSADQARTEAGSAWTPLAVVGTAFTEPLRRSRTAPTRSAGAERSAAEGPAAEGPAAEGPAAEPAAGEGPAASRHHLSGLGRAALAGAGRATGEPVGLVLAGGGDDRHALARETADALTLCGPVHTVPGGRDRARQAVELAAAALGTGAARTVLVLLAPDAHEPTGAALLLCPADQADAVGHRARATLGTSADVT